VAVLPSAPVRDALAGEIERLRASSGAVAWVAPENLHVTLKFLGHVEPSLLEQVAAALAGVAPRHPGFDLEIRGLGAFPGPSRPRVIWAALGTGISALATLAAGVETGLGAVGVPPEARPFSAHMTLGRVRQPGREAGLAAALVAGATLTFGRFRVDELVLMRSDLSGRGARYTRIGTWPLTRP
jgi:2'-5' RNA ligase